MNKKPIGSDFVYRCAACFAFLMMAAAAAFAQTDKSVEAKPSAPVEIPQPKALYEYIAPRKIFDFIRVTNEAGKRGFKLAKVTAVPSGSADSSDEKAYESVLAAVVRFDGEARYEYDFFFAEEKTPPDEKLNDLSQRGWRFREIVSVAGTGNSNAIMSLPTAGNLYLLERVVGDEKPSSPYKLLKAGVRLGKNPTEKMQGLLDAATAEGFVPLASYFTLDIKSLFSVDAFNGIIVGKIPEPRKTEYKFVRGNRSNGLRKEIETFAAQGWRIGAVNFNSGIMTRDAGQTAPLSYQWIETDDKKYAATLAAALAKNPSFVAAGVDMARDGNFIKNLLIFENAAGSNEYQFAKMQPIIPKQFKKNPQDYLKTLENPDIAFQKLLSDGYVPRDIFYSSIEGLNVIFERQKKN